MFLCFLNTVEFLTHYYLYLNLYNSAYFVTSACQLLFWEWFCSSILLTEYKRKWRKSTVLFHSFNKKRKTLRQITALSLRIFTINTVILFLVAILRLHSYSWFQCSVYTLIFTGLPVRPVIKWAFGRRCQKVVSRGREDTRVWYRETMFSQMVSYEFLLHDPLHGYFLYLACASPEKPTKRCEPEESYLRCSKRFDHGSQAASWTQRELSIDVVHEQLRSTIYEQGISPVDDTMAEDLIVRLPRSQWSE